MIEMILLIIRAIQMLFAIIILGLTAYLVSALPISTPRVNFMLFASLWTFLALIYLGLGVRFIQNTMGKFLAVILDLLTALFWFAGFIALAVLYNNGIIYSADYDFDFDFTYASYCLAAKNGCSVMEAAVVFGAFEWALFTASTALSTIDAFKNRNKSGGGGGITAPQMAAPPAA